MHVNKISIIGLLLALLLCLSMAGALLINPVSADIELVHNGGFESGNLAGWTIQDPPLWEGGVISTYKHSGSYSLFLAQVDSIYQAFNPPVSTTGDLSLWAMATGDETYPLVVTITYSDGTSSSTGIKPAAGYHVWVYYTFSVNHAKLVSKISFMTWEMMFPGYCVDDVSLKGTSAAYSVTIWAFAEGEGWMDWVPITKDGVSTGYSTPHTFTGLTGTHTFTVPKTEPAGRVFHQWNTGWTGTTLTVSSGGTYTANYRWGALTVTSPNGGQKWVRGTTHTLTWSSTGSPGSYVKIELLKGGVLNRVITSSTANDGSYTWTIPSTQTPGTNYKIRITSTKYSFITDSSNNNFAIVTGTLTVTSPNGGENWRHGTTHTITWSKTGSPGSNVKIELLKGGTLNRVISYSTANDGSYSWTIPSTQTLGTNYKIRITSTTYSYITDSSNNNFYIIT